MSLRLDAAGRERVAPESKTFKQLLNSIDDDDDSEELEFALKDLALVYELAEGIQEISMLCSMVQQSGKLGRVVELIKHKDPKVHSSVLLILAKMVDTEINSKAEAIRKLLRTEQQVSELGTHIFSPLLLVCLAACRILKTVCADIALVGVLMLEHVPPGQSKSTTAMKRLRALSRWAEQPAIAAEAKACVDGIGFAVKSTSTSAHVTRAVVRLQAERRRTLALRQTHLRRERRDAMQREADALQAEMDIYLAAVRRVQRGIRSQLRVRRLREAVLEARRRQKAAIAKKIAEMEEAKAAAKFAAEAEEEEKQARREENAARKEEERKQQQEAILAEKAAKAKARKEAADAQAVSEAGGKMTAATPEEAEDMLAAAALIQQVVRE